MKKIVFAALICVTALNALSQTRKRTRLIVNATPGSAADSKAGITKKRNIDKDNIVIDLASATTSVKYQVANNESFKVTFINLAPGAQYSLNDATTVKPVAPLEGLDSDQPLKVGAEAPDLSAAAAKQQRPNKLAMMHKLRLMRQP